MNEQHIVRIKKPNGYENVPFADLEAATGFARHHEEAQMFSRYPLQPFRYDAAGLHSLGDRTGTVGLEDQRTGKITLRSVSVGLDLYFGEHCVGHWPADRLGTGVDQRVMPGDLRRWIIAVSRDWPRGAAR